MVDSRAEQNMVDPIDRLTDRVAAVEGRLEMFTATVAELSATVAELSASTDRRFDAVDVAFLEQREYTEFAFDRLRTEMNERFDAMDKGMNTRFDAVDSRFARLERKLDQFIDVQTRTNALVERRLDAVERRNRPA